MFNIRIVTVYTSLRLKLYIFNIRIVTVNTSLRLKLVCSI